MTEMMDLVYQAKAGDARALETLIESVRENVYGLTQRMLYDPSDAEDAAQEIFMKIIAGMDSFKGKSAFSTWVYKVAVNHLIARKRNRYERNRLRFEEYEKDLECDIPVGFSNASDDPLHCLIAFEVRVSCIMGLLLCLDREHRIAFLISDVFDVTGEEGAAVMGVTPETFRKRLSRARKSLSGFLGKNCSLVASGASCSCANHASAKIRKGETDASRFMYAAHQRQCLNDEALLRAIREMDDLNRLGTIYGNYPGIAAPADLTRRIMDIIASGKYTLLGG